MRTRDIGIHIGIAAVACCLLPPEDYASTGAIWLESSVRCSRFRRNRVSANDQQCRLTVIHPKVRSECRCVGPPLAVSRRDTDLCSLGASSESCERWRPTGREAHVAGLAHGRSFAYQTISQPVNKFEYFKEGRQKSNASNDYRNLFLSGVRPRRRST